jgi:hypothetical protein
VLAVRTDLSTIFPDCGKTCDIPNTSIAGCVRSTEASDKSQGEMNLRYPVIRLNQLAARADAGIADTGSESARLCEPDDTLAPIAKSDSAVADLARWLAYGPDPRTLEQEALDPAPASGEELEATILAIRS